MSASPKEDVQTTNKPLDNFGREVKKVKTTHDYFHKETKTAKASSHRLSHGYQSAKDTETPSTDFRDKDSSKNEGSDFLQLFVKTNADDKNLILKARKDARVDKVFKVISKSKGTPTNRLRIWYNDKQLEYGKRKRLSDYHIQDQSTLCMIRRLGFVEHQKPQDEDSSDDDDGIWRLFVWPLCANCSDPNVHVMYIHKDATVDTLYQKISETSGIPSENMLVLTDISCAMYQLLECGQGKFLSEYPVQDQSTLHLAFIRKHPSQKDAGEEFGTTPTGSIWQFSIHTSSEQFNVRIHRGASVDALYRWVGERQGIPSREQRILYGEELLEYGKGERLFHYNMENKSTLYWYPSSPAAGNMSEELKRDTQATSVPDTDIEGRDMLQLYAGGEGIKVHKSATREDLYKLVSEKLNIPRERLLIIDRGYLLRDSQEELLSDWYVNDFYNFQVAQRTSISSD